MKLYHSTELINFFLKAVELFDHLNNRFIWLRSAASCPSATGITPGHPGSCRVVISELIAHRAVICSIRDQARGAFPYLAAASVSSELELMSRLQRSQPSILLPQRKWQTAAGCAVVETLCYKLKRRGFDTRSGNCINLPNSSVRTRPWGLLSL
jgi:hypothetical protein